MAFVFFITFALANVLVAISSSPCPITLKYGRKQNKKIFPQILQWGFHFKQDRITITIPLIPFKKQDTYSCHSNTNLSYIPNHWHLPQKLRLRFHCHCFLDFVNQYLLKHVHSVSRKKNNWCINVCQKCKVHDVLLQFCPAPKCPWKQWLNPFILIITIIEHPSSSLSFTQHYTTINKFTGHKILAKSGYRQICWDWIFIESIKELAHLEQLEIHPTFCTGGHCHRDRKW